MIEICNVKMRYGKNTVLNGINLKLNKGIYGLLGANGAGKTTLINLITGILIPNEGRILFNGVDIHDRKSIYRSKLGYMPQYTTFYPDFTAREFLDYICVIKEIPKKDRNMKIDTLLDKVNLLNESNKKIGDFSGGMRQRLGIAQALINDPELLVLDEPTAGLDPGERIRFRNLISDISIDRTVILATHIVQDVEFIANQLLLLHNGVITIQGKPKELIKGIEGYVRIVDIDRKDVHRKMKNKIVSNFFVDDGDYKVRVVSGDKELSENSTVIPNLEDVFLYYTQRENE